MRNIDLKLLREELLLLHQIASEVNLPITREDSRTVNRMSREELNLQISRLNRLLRVPKG